MKLTNHELELLADSISWELDFMQSKGWHTSNRAKTLQALQKECMPLLPLINLGNL